jgi:hypothetical protein
MYNTKAERDRETYEQKLMKTVCKNWEDLCFSPDILVPKILPDIIQLHYPPNFTLQESKYVEQALATNGWSVLEFGPETWQIIGTHPTFNTLNNLYRNLQAIGKEALKYDFLKVNNLKRNTTSLSCYCAQHKIAKLQDGDSLRNF